MIQKYVFSVGVDPVSMNKVRSPTWVSLSPLPRSHAISIALMKLYRWTNLLAISEAPGLPAYQLITVLFIEEMTRAGRKVTSWNLSSGARNRSEVVYLLTAAREITRGDFFVLTVRLWSGSKVFLAQMLNTINHLKILPTNFCSSHLAHVWFHHSSASLGKVSVEVS